MMQATMLTKERIKWAFVLFLAYLLFLLANIPASSLIKHLATRGISVNSSSGSVWHGQVTGFHAGVLNLGNIEWRVRFLPMLAGKLAADVSVKQSDGYAQGRVTLNILGTLQISELNASLPLQTLIGNGGLPGGWTGTAQAKFSELSFKRNWPISAHGTLDVIDLTGPSQQPSNIGAYRLSSPASGSNDTTLIGDLKDLDGASIGVTGQLKLATDRNYLLDTQVSPRANAPASIISGMQYLGAADAQGRRPFSISGSF